MAVIEVRGLSKRYGATRALDGVTVDVDGGTKLSGGQKQRLFIALALVGNPRVAILDELTTGLDPQARRSTWDAVAEMRDRGLTIVLVTHAVDEVQRLCDRVAVLDRGGLITVDTPAGLVAREGVAHPRGRRARPGEAVVKLVTTEFKLFLRDPAAAFFTLAFPLILLAVNGTRASREPAAALGGQRPIDVAAPMLMAMVVAMLGLTTLPPFLAYYRERGVLRRLAATPISPLRLIVAQLVVHLLIAAIGLAGLLVVGMTLFGMAAPKAPVSFGIALLVGSLAIFALGFVLAALAPTGRAASGIGLGVFFPMLFLSGVMVPREVMSEPLRRVGDWTPLAPVVRSLRETWAGGPLDPLALLVLGGITAVAGTIAARTFRW